ncbi:stage II sporulation protein R [Pasteuria penetrans]|uniref:stage II sporulation protein R n=1 Tax=Pasteuria penetrans TaxID=86005 RepID=UPI001CAA5772
MIKRKITLWIGFFITIFSCLFSRYQNLWANHPEKPICIQILAHSNSERDQWVKQQVKNHLLTKLGQLPLHTTAKTHWILYRHLGLWKLEIEELLRKYGFIYPIQITLGPISQPAKQLGNLQYPAGIRETLLIRLGSGKGENFFCVLFPPLCGLNPQVYREPEKVECRCWICEKFNKLWDQWRNGTESSFKPFATIRNRHYNTDKIYKKL